VNGRALRLDSRSLAGGFHPIERLGNERWRWTDGAAELRLPSHDVPVTLDLYVRDTMRVWAAPERRRAA
jgi:hypothetical protein